MQVGASKLAIPTDLLPERLLECPASPAWPAARMTTLWCSKCRLAARARTPSSSVVDLRQHAGDVRSCLSISVRALPNPSPCVAEILRQGARLVGQGAPRRIVNIRGQRESSFCITRAVAHATALPSVGHDISNGASSLETLREWQNHVTPDGGARKRICSRIRNLKVRRRRKNIFGGVDNEKNSIRSLEGRISPNFPAGLLTAPMATASVLCARNMVSRQPRVH